MKLFTNKAEIIAAIEEIRSTGKKLDNMIWTAAVSVLDKIDGDGNNGLAQSLVDAMPAGSRVNALIGFMEEFGKVTYDAATKKVVYAKTKKTDLAGAMATSWVEFKPEPPYAAMTIESALASLLTKAAAKAKLNDARDNINQDRAAVLAELSKAWKAADDAAKALELEEACTF